MSDIKISIIDREGKMHEVLAPIDMNMNLMEVIRLHELAPEGTIGICGGMAMCASCQCYVQSHEGSLPEKHPEEENMLDQAFFVKKNSRLSCQIPVLKENEGLSIELAPHQQDE